MNQSSIAVMKLTGELEFSRRDDLRERFRAIEGKSRVLLDFSEVTYADSTALTILVAFHKSVNQHTTRVAMLVTLPQFDRLLCYAGLQEAFVIFRDRGEALTYLAEPHTP